MTQARPLPVALAVFAASTLVAIAAGIQLSRVKSDEAADNLSASADRVASRIEQALTVHTTCIRAARRTLSGPGGDNVARKRFELYARSNALPHGCPAAHGVGFVRRLAAATAATPADEHRLDDDPALVLRELVAQADDHYLVELFEPELERASVMFLDLAGEPKVLAAASAATVSGEPNLTARLHHAERASEIWLILPVFTGDQSWPLTAAERVRSTNGWVFMPLSLNALLATVQRDARAYSLTLIDLTPGSDSAALFTDATDLDRGEPLRVHVRRHLFGRYWQLELRALPAFHQKLLFSQPAVVTMVGFLLGTMCSALVYSQLTSAERAQQLTAQQARIASIVESSSDAIVSCGSMGQITSWNAAAERLFGYAPDEVIGRSLRELCVPAERLHEDAEVANRLVRGLEVPRFDTTRRRRDETLVEVSVAAFPLFGARNEVIGHAATMTDVSEKKRAEQAAHIRRENLELEVAERTAELNGALTTSKRVARDLAVERQRLDNILLGTNVATWEWNVQTGETRLNSRWADLLGISHRHLAALNAQAWFGYVEPSDLERTRAALQAHFRGEIDHYSGEVRLRHRDGSWIWVLARGKVI